MWQVPSTCSLYHRQPSSPSSSATSSAYSTRQFTQPRTRKWWVNVTLAILCIIITHIHNSHDIMHWISIFFELETRKHITQTYLLSVDESLSTAETDARTLWLDTQSHASSSVSSDTADSDCHFSWPTSFWTQFKVWTSCAENLFS